MLASVGVFSRQPCNITPISSKLLRSGTSEVNTEHNCKKKIEFAFNEDVAQGGDRTLDQKITRQFVLALQVCDGCGEGVWQAGL